MVDHCRPFLSTKLNHFRTTKQPIHDVECVCTSQCSLSSSRWTRDMTSTLSLCTVSLAGECMQALNSRLQWQVVGRWGCRHPCCCCWCRLLAGDAVCCQRLWEKQQDVPFERAVICIHKTELHAPILPHFSCTDVPVFSNMSLGCCIWKMAFDIVLQICKTHLVLKTSMI